MLGIYLKQCPICGKEYRTDDHRAKYCSIECQKEGHKAQAREWARRKAASAADPGNQDAAPARGGTP